MISSVTVERRGLSRTPGQVSQGVSQWPLPRPREFLAAKKTSTLLAAQSFNSTGLEAVHGGESLGAATTAGAHRTSPSGGAAALHLFDLEVQGVALGGLEGDLGAPRGLEVLGHVVALLLVQPKVIQVAARRVVRLVGRSGRGAMVVATCV